MIRSSADTAAAHDEARARLWMVLLSHCNWLDERDREPEITAAIDAVVATAQPAWQPIATAPKDGTEVLLLKPNGEAEIGRYHSQDDLRRKLQGAMWRYKRSMSPAHDWRSQPTAWMALPQAGTVHELSRASAPSSASAAQK